MKRDSTSVQGWLERLSLQQLLTMLRNKKRQVTFCPNCQYLILLQALIGPIVEIEPFDSADQFPKGGVEISLGHFLEVPLLPEFSRDSADDIHQVIKFWSDDDDGVHQSVCGSFRTVDSSFFTFTENRHFCTYAGITFNRYLCKHNFPKTFAKQGLLPE